MNIALSIVRWILAISTSAALSFWIFLATINATVANREVVKGWIAQSGAYENTLKSDAIPIETENEGSFLTNDVLKEALVRTFDAAYLKQSAETIVDASYNWIDGSAQAIEFSIPVEAKSGEFNQHIIDLIMPKLLALPQCTERIQMSDPNKVTCITPGVEPIDYAEQLARPSNSNTFLSEPLTQDSFASATPNLPWLPTAYEWLRILVWALPLAMLVMCIAYVFASPDKLSGVIATARRLTLGAVLTLVGGIFMWVAGSSIDIATASMPPQQAAIANIVVTPIMREVLPDVGMALTLYSGIVFGIGGITWLSVAIWRHKRNSKPRIVGGPPVPPAPANAPESQLPTPLAKP